MNNFHRMKIEMADNPNKWLITGVAGFIGSNLLEELLNAGQFVTGVDNFSTGYRDNLEDVRREVGCENWARFIFLGADIRKVSACRKACQGVDYVLHQAALGSVPRSIDNPLKTNQSNVEGFLNMIWAAKEAKVKRFVYASSSSVYGDHPDLPKREEIIGRPLSPYAVTKYVNELYGEVFSNIFDFDCIGLRYFNVFGKRQDPDGAYAAVIPKWIGSFLNGVRPTINGDGETSRDFCYIKNVIQANLLAAKTEKKEALNQVYNIANGEQTTLNELLNLIKASLLAFDLEIGDLNPYYGQLRKGDVRHSLADISKAQKLLEYQPEYDVREGIKEAIRWYVNRAKENLI